MIAARAAAPPRRHVLFMANPLIRLLVAQGRAGVQNGGRKNAPAGAVLGYYLIDSIVLLPLAPVSSEHNMVNTPGGAGRYAGSGWNAALGLRATTVRSERAAGSGRTRPCSQLRSLERYALSVGCQRARSSKARARLITGSSTMRPSKAKAPSPLALACSAAATRRRA